MPDNAFTWPTAVVPLPSDPEVDRFAVYYENVCVRPSGPDTHDIGVAELRYDPDEGVDEPVQAEFLEPRLFEHGPEGWFGLSAMTHDGHAYVYRCPPSDGACAVARAGLDRMADPAAYEYWGGEAWEANEAAATPMAMPDPSRRVKISVERVEALGVFVMAEHRQENGRYVDLRVARRPWGPWSAPAEIELPECAGFYPEICFAAEVHGHLSDGDTVALTWFDPGRDTESPTRFAQVPVEIAGR
ncbi:MAG: DUF4185 domain-containing protein [Acidimicrobiia bacterium]|nr:DUF4185 domain-containing protein [Acidimicrobiia bacterium]